MDEIIGGWGKLHSEELDNFYSSPNINRITKSRMLRSAGHVALERSAYRTTRKT
jgi:hypothetical protein